MALKDPTYKTIFAAQIRAIQPTEEDVKEVKASLSDLKQLLPAGIDPDKDFDLLYVAGNLTVADVVNLNDDGVNAEDSLATYKDFERRFLDIEHDRKRLCGYILHAGLTEFGTDTPITEEQARKDKKPFNISIVAILWKAANPEMCAYIEEASVPTHSDYKSLSLSFEVGFENYKIIGIRGDSRLISQAELTVEPDSKDFARYNERLRVKKGDGRSPDDSAVRIYRVLKDGVKPIGGGVVSVPAAPVRGLVAITEAAVPVLPVQASAPTEEEVAAQEIEKGLSSIRQQFDLLATSLELKGLANIIFPKSSVSLLTTKTITASMKNPALQSVQEKISKATNLDEVKQIFASSNLSDIIAAESERLERDKQAAEALASDLQKAKDAAEVLNTQTKKDLDALKAEHTTLKTELDTIRTAQATAAAQQKFQERMKTLDDVFDLDDETRAFFLDEVKACASDEAFAKMLDKNKKFHKEKTKDFKKQKDADDKKKSDDAKAALTTLQASLAAKGVKTKLTDTGLDFEEIVASAAAAPVNPPVVNVVAPEKDLKERAKAAFAGAFTIAGRTIEQINAEPAKK